MATPLQPRVVGLQPQGPIPLAELLSDLLKLPFHKIKTTECTSLVQLLLRPSLSRGKHLPPMHINMHVSVSLFFLDQPEHLRGRVRNSWQALLDASRRGVPRQAAPPAMATSKVFLLLICSLGSLTDGTSARGQRMQQCRVGPCCSAPLAPAGPSLPPDLGTIIFLVRPHLPAGPGRAFLRVQLLLAGQHEARFPVLSPL